MIFPLLGLLFGAILGAFRANRRGGNRLDMLQWAAVHAVGLGIIGLFVLIIVERSIL